MCVSEAMLCQWWQQSRKDGHEGHGLHVSKERKRSLNGRGGHTRRLLVEEATEEEIAVASELSLLYGDR